MRIEPDGELIRELYARFGLAYYESECLHRKLCFVHGIDGNGVHQELGRSAAILLSCNLDKVVFVRKCVRLRSSAAHLVLVCPLPKKSRPPVTHHFKEGGIRCPRLGDF